MGAAFAPGLRAMARRWVVAEALGPPRGRAPHPLAARRAPPAAPADAPPQAEAPAATPEAPRD